MSGLLPPGTQLDDFRIEEQIHSGGMAVLYRVTGPDPSLPLIMKVPRLGFGEPASTVTSFEMEQTVQAALKGPHVPRFVANGDIEKQPYLVMELVEGRPLTDWTDRAPLEPAEVARLGAAIATALDSIHLQDAIHLDLKPGNVLVRPNGEAVLIDFGLAHHRHFPDLLAEEFQRPIGTASYISPEQVLGVRFEPLSDVFALGVVLYELATGRLPYGAPTSRSGLRKRLYRDPLPPRVLVKTLPEWLQEVILRCLEIEASLRYPSAAQVAFDLSHPDQVAVTDRGRRLRRSGLGKALRRWFRVVGFEPMPGPSPSAHVAGGSIVLAALVTSHQEEARFEALREAVKHLLAESGHARLACTTVVRPAPEASASYEDQTATSQHIKHLVLLRHWAEPLDLPPDKISFHVLEANDGAEALLRYARANQVDHIVIGSPPAGVPLKGLLNAVSMRVAAEAPCSVTIVRSRTVG